MLAGEAFHTFGKQLWEMKALIKDSGNFRSEDEKRICLALAMQVEGTLRPMSSPRMCSLRRSSKHPAHRS